MIIGLTIFLFRLMLTNYKIVNKVSSIGKNMDSITKMYSYLNELIKHAIRNDKKEQDLKK